MRLQSIHIENFLGVRLVDLQHLMPVTVIAGPNGAGKSSLRDGIALALTGDLGRVTLKKEAGALVRDGADAAVCEVRCTDGDTWAATITAAGKLTSPIGKKGADADPVMPLVLDAQRFARLDATERRAFLFDLTGLKTDGKAVAGRLLARGCEQAKVERVQPLLRAGFDAAHKQARTNATEAKGAWRALTGETYGAQKAQTWQAGVPAHNAEGIPSLQTEIRHADAALATWQKTIGRLQAVEKHRAELGAKLAPLREHAAQLERIRARAAVNETELRRIDAEVAAATAATGAGPRVGLVHDIAAHLALMIDHGDRMGWFADSGDREIRGAASAPARRPRPSPPSWRSRSTPPSWQLRAPRWPRSRSTAVARSSSSTPRPR
ncbi:AAA family ATPase [Piscinibacter sakaiensis]|uniref:AAA family ATPase n=1 Tax=Piscinibacter sakaiensis TaxID=1547922 RepID=UPI00372CB513